jgi:MFS family permease
MSSGSDASGTPASLGLGLRFWSLIGATFLGFLGFGTVLPGLAPYVKHTLGGSDETVGFVVGVFSFVALAGRLISGPLADRRGRKICFQVGLGCCICAGAVYLLPIGLASAYLGRMLQGMGEACLYTGAATWVVEAAGVERSGRALGLLSSAIWGGVSAGPVVGQYIGSFQHAAMLQVVTAILALIVVSLIPEDYHVVHHEAKKQWLPKRLLAPGFAVGLVNVHYPVIAGFLILHLASHGNSGPAAFAAYALLIMLSRFFLGGLPDRIHPAITYNAGIGIMAVGLVAIALGPPPFVAIGSAALLGFGFSFPWSAVAATLMRHTPARERGSAISILSAFYDLFVGTSSFAAGIVAHRFGYSAAFFLAVGSLVLAAIVGRIVFRPDSSIYHMHGEAPVEAETLSVE